ncbi:hypothetical protein U3516DRAFT_748963 [Neocallimastix sp. 'constans']
MDDLNEDLYFILNVLYCKVLVLMWFSTGSGLYDSKVKVLSYILKDVKNFLEFVDNCWFFGEVQSLNLVFNSVRKNSPHHWGINPLWTLEKLSISLGKNFLLSIKYVFDPESPGLTHILFNHHTRRIKLISCISFENLLKFSVLLKVKSFPEEGDYTDFSSLKYFSSESIKLRQKISCLMK